ncbi:MAG: glycosyltransferase [Firmicutes bacterium]|nr:glycosyltransferase [Bacillota bacterium]
MITISLCLIVKNEEEVLERCLDSAAHLADEVILLDTGSDDGTKAIAAGYSCRIYDFPWIDDFAAARNKAFSYATGDYIFWLDADDVLTPEDQQKFRKLKETLAKDVDVVTMPYHLAFDEYGNVSFSLRRNRLVKRSRHFQWRGRVHEYLEVSGTIIHSDVAVVHKSKHNGEGAPSDRNLRIYRTMIKDGQNFTPRDLYYYGNELVDHKLYQEAIPVYEKFLQDNQGWVEDNIACCGKMADCYYNLGQKEKAVACVLRAFAFDTPRPEFCCRLGYHFLETGNYLAAVFWYTLATRAKPGDNFLAFTNQAAYTWLPHLQLCVCYSKLGAYRLAYLHNEAARHFRPEDPIMLSNKTFLEQMLSV